ncbi:MAG: aminotransferase class I/II-fold pyridoxal phosphate-dependent enzyme [Acidimicrobiaceae bacterium]|nr:aminotransferase class I/II-fold pyridoxal phosphate-dependent enzyme [Acidimicrobiaceae bacterium]
MEFRRISGLPPYVFAAIDSLKAQERRAGKDVIDLGFGNPDIPSPDIAVEKLAEAARNPRNHRYSSSKGLPNLRKAVADMYMRKFSVELDPETEVVSTIGAKEGFSHVMWVLVGPGDVALVPSPSYPIHIWGPLFAGAEVRQVRLGPTSRTEAKGEAPKRGNPDEFLSNLVEAFESSWPRPRVIVISFPHNPTTTSVDLEWMTKIVEFAREREVTVVHDFAYSDTAFDGYKPPSVLQVPGAKEVAVELYTLTKSYSMAGWRSAFMVGNKDVVAALTKLKSYLDYGTFQPIQIAATVTLNEADSYPPLVNAIYQSRRDVLCEGLNRIGWQIEKPRGTMFVWSEIPEPYQDMQSLEFAKFLVSQAQVAVSPGVGFGPGGEGFVRFALIENEQRIHQALRNLKRALPKL